MLNTIILEISFDYFNREIIITVRITKNIFTIIGIIIRIKNIIIIYKIVIFFIIKNIITFRARI